MNATPTPIEIFLHVRVIIGIVLGIAMTRLLTGVSRFIQHPDKYRVYLVHFGWVVILLLDLMHFWWWEFYLIGLESWHFEIYLFLILYAILYFLLCTLLFPESVVDHQSYEEFFISRRKWFFGLLAVSELFSVVDTRLKGAAHYSIFATEFLVQVPIYVTLCAIAIWTPNRRFHQFFVLAGLVYEITWIFRQFDTLG